MILQTFIVDENATNNALSGAVKEQLESGIAEADREKYGDLSKEEIEEQKKLDRLLGKIDEEDYRGNSLVFTIDEKSIMQKNTFLRDINIALPEIKAVYIDNINKVLGFDVMIVLVNGIEVECKYEKDKYLEICAYLETIEKVSIGSALLAKEQVTLALNDLFRKSNISEKQKEEDKIVPISNFDNNKN